jgi:hypothetical protein
MAAGQRVFLFPVVPSEINYQKLHLMAMQSKGVVSIIAQSMMV